jgi:hypothetical protein
VPKLSREFSFGWIPVESSQQGKTHVSDMRFFRRDLETGREISNEFIHGANDALREQAQTVQERVSTRKG